jgi:hypothetical protein
MPSIRSTTTPSRRGGDLGRTTGRQLGAELLQLGLQGLDLVELALHAVDDVAGAADELARSVRAGARRAGAARPTRRR